MGAGILENLRRCLPFYARDRRIGSAQGKRVYDLPLNKSSDTNFLLLLIALMSFLAVLALIAGFILSGISTRWAAGLENKATIEIPAQTLQNDIRSPEDIQALISEVEALLVRSAAVENFDVLEKPEIESMLEPWMGQAGILGEIPVPGLISVELVGGETDETQTLQDRLEDIAGNIKLDTHESWLGDLLRLTGALQYAALFIFLIIGFTTVIAIAGAIRARMAIYNEEIELLHLMGASDSYISRQFQRHALIVAFKGSLAGLIAGMLVMLLLGLFAGDTAGALLPHFEFTLPHYLAFASLPVLACLIAAATARRTVMAALAEMP